MLHFFSLLLISLTSSGISNIVEKENGLQENYMKIEIIIQKYKALGATEIDEVKNERYDFRFCACKNETSEPERSGDCSCSIVVSGQTTQNSIPQALYSSSCVHNPHYNKCLIAQITANTTQNLLYIEIRIGPYHLTDPPYQSITNSRFKNTALLSCSKDIRCRDCIPCKSGFIQLSYISLSSVPLADSEQPYLSAAVRFDKRERWPDKSLRKLSFTETNMQNFDSIAKIEERLLQSAKKHHLLPAQFNIAIYKDVLVSGHNIYRHKHGVGLLEANSELERIAEIWAERLASKADCLIHDPSKRFGENLFYYATNLLPDEETMALMTVQSFYLEAHGYNYKTHHHLDYHRTGHFTQLVWKSTTQVGVGVAMRNFNGRRVNKCQPDFPSTLIYVVVKYDPPGNVLDKRNYDDNVLPPIQ
uniref:SCP domain-containing protein n=1 Tax=Wuchereria bancrofti TaxID=6293 RepID=A0AAF5PGG0_WUCBA